MVEAVVIEIVVINKTTRCIGSAQGKFLVQKSDGIFMYSLDEMEEMFGDQVALECDDLFPESNKLRIISILAFFTFISINLKKDCTFTKIFKT